MRWNSIRSRVLAVLFACLIIGVTGTLALMHYSFARNSQALAAEAINGAQKLFTILEAREISKMTAVSETLQTNPQVRDAFAAKDRARLMDLTAPLYADLKREGITNWMFHTPGPDMAVFVRLHNPSKFGDHLSELLHRPRSGAHAFDGQRQRAGQSGVRCKDPHACPRFSWRPDRVSRVRRRTGPLYSHHERSDPKRLRPAAKQEVR